MTVSTARIVNLKEVSEILIAGITRDLERLSRTCINCEHFYEAKEFCLLAEAHPPARIIAFGCEKFEDQIPF